MATTITLNLNLDLTLIHRRGAEASANTAAILGHESLTITLIHSFIHGQLLLNYPFGATSTLCLRGAKTIIES